MSQNMNITPNGTLASQATVPSVKSAAKGSSSDTLSLAAVLAQAAYFLSEIEADIAGKYNLNKTQSDDLVVQSEQTLSKQRLNDAISQAKKIQAEQDAINRMNPIEKAFSVIASVLVAAFALLAGQPEVAALMIVMTVMNESGATNAIIGNNLGATLGMLAVVTVLSFGVGTMATTGEAAEVAAQAGARVGQEAAEEAGEEAAEIAAENGAEQGPQAAKSFLSKVLDAIMPRLSVALTIQNDIQMLLSTQAIQNIAKAANLSQEDLAILTGILMAIAILSSVAAGKALASGAGEVEAVGQGAAGKLKAALKTFISKLNLNNPKVLFGMRALQNAFNAGTSGMQIAQGTIELNQANLTKAMADDYAIIDLVQTLMAVANNGIANSEQQVNTLLKGHQDGTGMISSWLDGQRQFTQVLASNSPV